MLQKFIWTSGGTLSNILQEANAIEQRKLLQKQIDEGTSSDEESETITMSAKQKNKNLLEKSVLTASSECEYSLPSVDDDLDDDINEEYTDDEEEVDDEDEEDEEEDEDEEEEDDMLTSDDEMTVPRGPSAGKKQTTTATTVTESKLKDAPSSVTEKDRDETSLADRTNRTSSDNEIVIKTIDTSTASDAESEEKTPGKRYENTLLNYVDC